MEVKCFKFKTILVVNCFKFKKQFTTMVMLKGVAFPLRVVAVQVSDGQVF